LDQQAILPLPSKPLEFKGRQAGAVSVLPRDRDTIRALATDVAAIAALPVHDQKRRMWTRLNRLDPVRPMVWINELPWTEMDDDDLRCITQDPVCRSIEDRLRRTRYLWRRMPADMVVDGVFFSPAVFSDSGYGVDIQSVLGQSVGGHGSRDYVPVLRDVADLDRIQCPEIVPDWDETTRRFELTADLIGDIMPVEVRGVCHIWAAPWDTLIQWWGVEELYRDMFDRPGFVHAGISRMVDAMVGRLDQLEEQGLLSAGNGNYRVGSGGLGITDELPQADFDGNNARAIDQWGTSTGQIFSEVSPAMHDEFCLQYELRWLERFGLNCYGCCEPLDQKMEILRKVPRLRRVSMSPWIDLDRAVDAVGRDYVFSHKPSPSLLAWDSWEPHRAREELCCALERTRGCVVEVIMKDVTTCRNDPRRLWEWCELAVQVAEEYA